LHHLAIRARGLQSWRDAEDDAGQQRKNDTEEQYRQLMLRPLHAGMRIRKPVYNEHAQNDGWSARPPGPQCPDRGPDCPNASVAGRSRRGDAGFVRMMRVNLGYDPHNIMSVGIPVHDNTYTTWEARRAYFDQLLRKATATPEVVSAALSTNATPPSTVGNGASRFPASRQRSNNERVSTSSSPQYFSVLHIPLLQGRIWDESETMHGSSSL